MIGDTIWWIELLKVWEASERTGREYKIFSASELEAEPSLVYVLQSDAAGIDGIGYYHGCLEEEDPEYYSRPWADISEFKDSMHGELKALEHFVSTTDVSDKLLIWVSDALSAVWSINKGRCRDPYSLEVVASILTACDEKGLQLIALWVPRESNVLADYLSHLATHMNRSEVRGRLSGLGEGAQSSQR